MNEEEILNIGTRIGIQLHNERVKSSQVNKLLEIIESEKDPKIAITLLGIYVQKQRERGYIRDRAAREITGSLLKILNSDDVNKDLIRKILGIAKWVYESVGSGDESRPRVNVQEPQSLLKYFAGVR